MKKVQYTSSTSMYITYKVPRTSCVQSYKPEPLLITLIFFATRCVKLTENCRNYFHPF